MRRAPRFVMYRGDLLLVGLAGRGAAMETKRILFVKGQRLTRQLNIRRTLLAAVDHFLEGSPGSLTKAHRLVASCYAARQFVTLDEIVWGGVIMALTDAEYYSHVPRLQQYRTLLSEGSAEIHRAYLNFDFGSDFTPQERASLNRLDYLLDFLGGCPVPTGDSAPSQARSKHAGTEGGI